MSQLSAGHVQIDEPVVAISIGRTYRDGISAEELYESTRGIWRLNPQHAEEADLAFAVYQGQIKEVYEVERWQPAGTADYEHREFDSERLEDRYECVGDVASEDLREKYVGRNMPVRHGQNPIRYINC